ncbi:FecR family protein [Pedobacter xixiisoli]|uniref:FecR family protein n=1 Tax=Pedobacter xixiisoli TaxID=1476464 RepID=A0A285ZZL4_9SPHI|nr:FecR family protein [Pedobacter xixiisoli]SOD15075.1 FecR family protein [Pedobacter xixiisoli]
MNNHIPNNIQELIAKALKGQISEEENELLELWYNQALPDQVEWKGAEKNAPELKHKIFNQITSQIQVNRPTVKLLLYKYVLFRVAASVVLVAGLAYYFGNKKDVVDEQLVSTQENGVKKIILPDSSIVWLKGKSTLLYPEHFTDSIRVVELNGEALFEVAKDKDHPFIIKTGNYSTRVLGTSFNLNTRNKNYNLIVLTGKVQVNELDPVNNTNKVLAVVTPNQRFDRLEQSKGEISAPEEVEKITVTKGTEYPMYFMHTPFSEIMDRIERKFNMKFAKADYSSYATCNINADLTDQSLKNSLEILAAAMGAQYKIENQTIMIEGGGCR